MNLCSFKSSSDTLIIEQILRSFGKKAFLFRLKLRMVFSKVADFVISVSEFGKIKVK